ncbi:leucine aminopeptidase 1-like protein, partial [Tanacetum coccineum]
FLACHRFLSCRLLLADSCLTTLACRLLLDDFCLPSLACRLLLVVSCLSDSCLPSLACIETMKFLLLALLRIKIDSDFLLLNLRSNFLLFESRIRTADSEDDDVNDEKRTSRSSTSAYRRLGESVASAAKTYQVNNVVVILATSEGLTPKLKLTTASAITTGILLGTNEDNRYKSESKKPTLKSVDFFLSRSAT